MEYVIGKREIGHIHSDHLVDIPFPKKVRDEIVAAGRAQPHHILPESGWVSFYLREDGDVDRAIELLREKFEIAMRQKSNTVNHKSVILRSQRSSGDEESLTFQARFFARKERSLRMT